MGEGRRKNRGIEFLSFKKVTRWKERMEENVKKESFSSLEKISLPFFASSSSRLSRSRVLEIAARVQTDILMLNKEATQVVKLLWEILLLHDEGYELLISQGLPAFQGRRRGCAKFFQLKHLGHVHTTTWHTHELSSRTLVMNCWLGLFFPFLNKNIESV